MSTIKITGAESVATLADRVAGVDARLLARAVNHPMNQVRTKVRREVAKASGAPYGRVLRVVKSKPATSSDLSYSIDASDTFLDLSAFKARQTKRGVSAAPWGQRRTFPGTFIIKRWRGRVYVRVKDAPLTPEAEDRIEPLAKFNLKGSSRFPIRRVWGSNLAREMTREGEAPLETWRGEVAVLPAKVIRRVASMVEAGIK